MKRNHNVIGTYIRYRRIAMGLTQRELARTLKIHPQLISNIERGVMHFPLKRSKNLCKALSVTEKQWRALVVTQFEERLDQAL